MVPLLATECALCAPGTAADEVYPATLRPADLNSVVFSARRAPDRVHYRIVRCRGCGLVRSDPVSDEATHVRLYAASTLDYAAEIPNLVSTYTRYLRRAMRRSPGREHLLEIGCGNGFMLDAALDLGFARASGVEPSLDAVRQASPRVRDSIVQEAMRPGLFRDATFDVVCMFQTLDHVSRPQELLQECRRVLRPGGVFLALHHDVRALSARVLGERSPIFDVEHTYLYSNTTMRRLLQRVGLRVLENRGAMNTLSVDHLMRLLPLPGSLRTASRVVPHSWRLTLPLGNLYTIAQKPFFND